MRPILFPLLLIAFLFFSCNPYKNSTFSIASVNNNVCKKLTGNVVLYAIFVDTKHTQPWSGYDIQTTLDSIHKATNWIEKQAKESGIPLNIEVRYHQRGKVVPVANNFQDRTLSATLYNQSILIGIPKVNRWADRVATIAGQSLPKDTSGIIGTVNRITNRERLIARLRDLYKTDNVALLYFINNYYQEEISVAIHTSSHSEIEYGIVSFKSPAVIAHEFLHLFGAWDLYISPFLKKQKTYFKKEMAEKIFPDEVMAFAYRDLESLTISPFSKYLIGWDDEMDEKYLKHFGNKIRFIRY